MIWWAVVPTLSLHSFTFSELASYFKIERPSETKVDHINS